MASTVAAHNVAIKVSIQRLVTTCQCTMRLAILAAWLSSAMVDLQASAMMLTWCEESSLRAAEAQKWVSPAACMCHDNGAENALIASERSAHCTPYFTGCGAKVLVTYPSSVWWWLLSGLAHCLMVPHLRKSESAHAWCDAHAEAVDLENGRHVGIAPTVVIGMWVVAKA